MINKKWALNFTRAESKLFEKIMEATKANICEWDSRYRIQKIRREKESADELHWEATMRYYFSKDLQTYEILFRESSRGVDLTERDCQFLTGEKFTAELRYTYHEPPRCWNVFTPKRRYKDTNLYLILLPHDRLWDERKMQGFPDLKNKVGACGVTVETISDDVALVMVKLLGAVARA